MAVDMPSRFDRGVKVEVEGAIAVVIQVEIPQDGVVDLGGCGDAGSKEEREQYSGKEMQGLHGHVALRAGR